jgi:hypothetical protein
MPTMARDCKDCGEEKDIVAGGLCGRCYMRARRAAEAANLKDLWAQPKKHEIEKRRFQKRARKSLNAILDNLDSLESPPFLDPEAVNVIRFLVKTALMRSAQGINPEFTPEEKSERDQNLESSIETSESGMPKGELIVGTEQKEQSGSGDSELRQQLRSALLNQGYSRAGAKQMADAAEGTNFESMLRSALKMSGRAPADAGDETNRKKAA